MPYDFAVTDDLTLSHVKESTFGVTPANPALKRIRANGESLNANIQTAESEEINPIPSVVDLVRTGQSAGGQVPFDFAKSAAFDEILEAVLRGTWTAGVLKGGVTKTSFTVMKKLLAATARYQVLSGARYNGLTIEGQVGQLIKGSYDLMAVSVIHDNAGVALGTGSITEPAATRVMSMVDVNLLSITGDTTPLVATQFSLSIENGCRIQPGQGQLAGYGIGYGKRRVRFTMSAYFEDWEQMNRLLNGTAANLQIGMTDGTNTYVFRLPRLKYSNVTANAGQANSDIIQQIEGVATYDPTAGVLTDIMVTRTPTV